MCFKTTVPRTAGELFSSPLFLVAFLAAVLIAFQIVYSTMVVLTLLVGMPAILLVLNERTKNAGLLVMLGLAPFLGIIKAYTGVRYAPITLDIALLVLVISPIINKAIHGRKFYPLEKMVSIFLAISIAQIFNPNVPDLNVGLEGFRAIAYQSLGLYAGALLINSKKQIKQIVFVLCGTATLVAVYGLKQFFYPSSIDQTIIALTGSAPITYTSLGQMRAFSTMSGPFHLGLFMVLTILLIVALIEFKKLYGIFIPLILLFSFVLILTITRSNWIGVATGIVALTMLKAGKQKQMIIAGGKIVISFFILSILIVGCYELLQSISNLPGFEVVFKRLESLFGLSHDEHLLMRIASWRDTILPAIIEQPLGYGPASSLDSFSHRADFIGQSYFSSHSQYLKVALELGIPGFIVFASILVMSLIVALRTYFQLTDRFLKSIAAWVFALVIAICVSGFTAPMLDIYPVNLYYWFFLGVLIRLKDIERFEVIPKYHYI